MFSRIKILLLSGFMVLSCSCKDTIPDNSGPADSNYEFEMPDIPEPDIPRYTVNIKDFGAIPDGRTLNTKAIADAIDDVSKKGGGKVVIPAGLWLTGPIVLKSNLELHAEQGALIIFSPDKDLYPLVETSFEGNKTVRCISPVYGRDLENIAFTGKGIYDGTGEVWRPVKKEKLTESQWKKLLASGGVLSDDGKQWFPSQAYYEGQKLSSMNVPDRPVSIEDYSKIKDFLRPVMVSLISCKRILFDGPVFQNSPAWCIHPLMCEDLIVRNITVKNPWFSQNGDGIDIESCKNAIVTNSNFDVGDDAICIKSGKDKDGRDRGIPTENLIIENCVVYHGHGGVTVGSEMSGGVRNVYVSNCIFIGTDVGIRFKSNRGRGGIVENIHFTDIDMINIPTQAISFNLYYGGLSVSEMLAQEKSGENETEAETIPPVSEETPVFRNISMKNITCRGALQAVFLQGLPEMNLENITMENIDITADNGMTCIDANGLIIKGMKLSVKNTPAIDILNSRDIEAVNVELMPKQNNNIRITGKKSEKINLKINGGYDTGDVIFGEEVNKNSISIL